MSKFKNALKTIGELGEAVMERRAKIDDMCREITRRGYGLDPVETKKIAEILVDQADVTWTR